MVLDNSEVIYKQKRTTWDRKGERGKRSLVSCTMTTTTKEGRKCGMRMTESFGWGVVWVMACGGPGFTKELPIVDLDPETYSSVTYFDFLFFLLESTPFFPKFRCV